MDLCLSWKISDDVESLVKCIKLCKLTLEQIAQTKLGDSTRVIESDVYAGDKISQLLMLSKVYEQLFDVIEEDQETPMFRRQHKTSEMLGKFPGFLLHKLSVLGETNVRVVVSFVADGHGALQTMYGDISVAS